MDYNIDSSNFDDLNEVADEYELIYKDINIILDELELKDALRVRTKVIIQNLEKQIADTIRADKCASIPHIGNICKHPSVGINQKHGKEFRKARNTMSMEDYKDFVRSVFYKEYDKMAEDKARRDKADTFRKQLFKPYMKLFDKFGQAYANVWLYSRTHWSVIEFDFEVEETYREYYGET